MGYRTYFTLEILEGDEQTGIELARKECQELADAVDENGAATAECKWYEYEKDMKEMSKKMPDYLFKLSGEGEESCDIWHAYFKSGKMQHCPVVMKFDEYNPEKLA
jgi:hypothetical protein